MSAVVGLVEVMCRLIGRSEKDIASFPAKDTGNDASESWGKIRQTHMVIHKITDGLQNNWLKTFQHVKVMKDKERLRNCYRWKEHDKDIL